MNIRKVKLAFIINNVSRKATLRKMKRGFMKKMYEINKLCDVPTCAIMYSPDESQPDVWPDSSGRIKKEQEKLNKLKKQNREKQIQMLMNQCLTGKPLTGLDFNDLEDMGSMINETLKDIVAKIKSRKEEELVEMDQPSVAQPPMHASVTDENFHDTT
ncbi:hypothetical protein ACFX10_010189 [Malus domestica]